jgi:hypothetical protein
MQKDALTKEVLTSLVKVSINEWLVTREERRG